MKYHELLELYKKKELGEEQCRMVERDIEKHQAISEYLFEKEEKDISAFTLNDGEKTDEESDLHDSGDLETEPRKKKIPEKAARTADDFTKRVNRAIRRAFLKMGAAVCAVTLVIVLLILFVFPDAVSSFYYDPGRIVGEDNSGRTTNQMSLDMAIFTELAMPGHYRDSVQVEDRGYGNYDINIYQNVSRSGEFHHVAGRVERETLTLYDPNLFNPSGSNVFGWFQMNMDYPGTLTELSENGQGDLFYTPENKEQSAEYLNQLDDNKYYLAYVTLDRILPYDEFISLAENYSDRTADIWCTPRTMEGSYQPTGRSTNLGFYIQLGQTSLLDWDREKYPDLILWSVDDLAEWDAVEEKIKDETFAAEHFAVMLDYMSEQDEFLGMTVGQEGEKYAEAADYVRENGLEVYGFACVADKETLAEMNAEEDVFGVHVEEIP